MITDEQYLEAYSQMAEYEKGISDHNNQIIDSFGDAGKKDFERLMDYCRITEKIEFVDAPQGKKQNENFGIFKNVHVDQHSVGDSGDSYAGFVYAKVKGRWIKVPYDC